MRFYWQEIISNKGKTSTVNVYQILKDGSIYYIDSMESSRGSYRGGRAIACQILHDEFGFQWSEPSASTHYILKRRDIHLFEFPN